MFAARAVPPRFFLSTSCLASRRCARLSYFFNRLFLQYTLNRIWFQENRRLSYLLLREDERRRSINSFYILVDLFN